MCARLRDRQRLERAVKGPSDARRSAQLDEERAVVKPNAGHLVQMHERALVDANQQRIPLVQNSAPLRDLINKLYSAHGRVWRSHLERGAALLQIAFP